MNTPIDDGGPAFPIPDVYHPNGQVQYGTNGMSLRDWFAGQALTGAIAGGFKPKNNDEIQKAAETYYVFADAMLAERKENK